MADTEPLPADQAPEAFDPPRWWRLRGRSYARMAVEVLLISAGVFLGLAGEQWRENAQNRAQARETLRRFRAELTTNRAQVIKVSEYHRTQHAAVRAYLAADESARAASPLKFQGLQPPFLERTAWDLALATQALAHIDADVAYGLSKIYLLQEFIDQSGRAIAQAMFLRTPQQEYVAFLSAVELYYGDLLGLEPALVNAYDLMIPEIDRVLGDGPVD